MYNSDVVHNPHTHAGQNDNAGMREMENLIHVDAINEEFDLAVVGILPFDDVPTRVAELVHAANSPAPWATLDVDKKKKKESQGR